MARAGTNRGGARLGAGRKPKPLFEKIREGKAADPGVLPEPPELEGLEVPPIKDFMKAAQKSGKDLCAEEVFRTTWKWLKERGCEKQVSLTRIEQYAMSVSRWIQGEECVSEYDPGKAPYYRSALLHLRGNEPELHEATNQIWYQIFQ